MRTYWAYAVRRERDSIWIFIIDFEESLFAFHLYYPFPITNIASISRLELDKSLMLKRGIIADAPNESRKTVVFS
jgi:hypothetical protein